jgi:hypothetical protein
MYQLFDCPGPPGGSTGAVPYEEPLPCIAAGSSVCGVAAVAAVPAVAAVADGCSCASRPEVAVFFFGAASVRSHSIFGDSEVGGGDERPKESMRANSSELCVASKPTLGLSDTSESSVSPPKD